MTATPPNPPTNIGSNKASASGLAGAVVTIVIWGVNAAWGVTIPAEVAAAITTVVGTVLVWLVPHGGG